jgi:membrane-bound lytic murein transglycosylase B
MIVGRLRWVFRSTIAVICCLTLFGAAAAAEEWEALILKLDREGFPASDMRPLFEKEEVQFDPEPMRKKMTTLFEVKFRAGRIRSIQEGLVTLGFDPGPVDGLEGPKTRSAIIRFQKRNGWAATGKPSAQTLEQIDRKLHPEKYLEKEEDTGPSVYKSILVPERLAEAKEFRASQSDLLRQVERKYGVPPEIVVAILTVETRVGNYLGSRKAFTTLASMALCSDFKYVEPFFEQETLTRERRSWAQARSRRTANWAYKELKALLEYAAQNDLDPLNFVGSVYGAIGISQFMPSSAIHYGVDGNGDGVVNLFEMEDALHSLANYVKEHGWKGKIQGRRTQARVLYRYNRSRTYVNTVLAVADHLTSQTGSQARAM